MVNHTVNALPIKVTCSDGRPPQNVSNVTPIPLHGRYFWLYQEDQYGNYWRSSGHFSADGRTVSGKASTASSGMGDNGPVTCSGEQTFTGHLATRLQAETWGVSS